MRFVGLFALLIALQPVTCTKAPADEAGGSESGGGSGSGSESGGSESGGGASGGSESGTDTGTSDTGGDACDGYVDEAADPPWQIAVTNTRPDPVYLMSADDCTQHHIHVIGAGSHWPPSDCEPTCAQLIAGNCACPEACFPPVLLRIEAGSTYTLDWPFVLVPDQVPATCIDPNLCGSGDCPNAVAPPDGDYTISADVVYAPADCEGIDDPCACTPGESSCLTTKIYLGAPDLDLDFPTTLPDGSLELVIE